MSSRLCCLWFTGARVVSGLPRTHGFLLPGCATHGSVRALVVDASPSSLISMPIKRCSPQVEGWHSILCACKGTLGLQALAEQAESSRLSRLCSGIRLFLPPVRAYTHRYNTLYLLGFIPSRRCIRASPPLPVYYIAAATCGRCDDVT